VRRFAPFGRIEKELVGTDVINRRHRNISGLADKQYARLHSIAQWHHPANAVDKVLLLMSGAGRYITGQTLLVDGGISVGALRAVPRASHFYAAQLDQHRKSAGCFVLK